MIDYVYFPVVAAFVCVLYRARSIWSLAQSADRQRHITHFAQFQIVFAVTLSVMAIVLSCAMLPDSPVAEGWLRKWWAIFDIVVALALLSQLSYLQHSLKAGRHG